ncbi:MAG TPA: two-component regulator propeller domain-containing protein [Melioribacteraceae bacterium]|nr:two-component regulator propeller domain-containing protein [Melioribacteraceae bacterium]
MINNYLSSFIFILFSFILNSVAVAQAGNWIQFDTTNCGLPSNTIRCVTQDPAGNYWIGTWDKGLVKYDGKNWSVFNKENSPLPHNCVYSIAFNNGHIYIGTMGGGLAVFDGNSEWKVFNEKNSGIPQDWIYSVAFDKQSNIWVGTFSNGLGVFENGNWTIYDKTNSILIDNKVTYIYIDDNNNKYLATQGELAFIIDGVWKSESDLNVDSLSYVAYWISETSDKNKLISYKYGDLVLFDGLTFKSLNKGNPPIPIQGFYSAVEDKNKKIWAGSFGEGIIIYDFNKCIHWNKSNSPLKDNFVFNVFVDSYNNKWISTYFGGIAIYNEDEIRFSK